MSLPTSFRLAAALIALSLSTVHAQQSNLSYLDFTPCCIVPDGQGNSFIVGSSALPVGIPQPVPMFVMKVDAAGNVISEFPFMAGSNDQAAAAAVDPAGNLWIVGSTAFAPFQNSSIAGLIAKLDSTGTHVLFTGTFGGQDSSSNHGTGISAIAFDPAGNLYLAGSTTQLDFPVTPGAIDTAIPFVATGQELSYGFVVKLSPASQADPPYTVAYSTLLGGEQVPEQLPCSGSCYPLIPSTAISLVAVDASGAATVAGTTSASDFPVTPGAFQTQLQGTLNVSDVFVSRLNPAGTGLVWSTFLGETNSQYLPALGGIALDASGNVAIAGITTDPGFPTTSGAVQSQFATPPSGTFSAGDYCVAQLDSNGAKLLFSTYYGMAGSSTGMTSAPLKLRLDAQGDIWIAGLIADPSSLALRANSLELGNSLLAELAPDGSSVLFSELLPNGMAGQDLTLNPDGSLSMIGPPANGVGPAFLLRQPRSTPSGVSILGVADSAASLVTRTVAPGEYVSIYGNGLGPATGVGMQLDSTGKVSTSLGGTQVSFDGVSAPLIYAAENQINVLVPYEIANNARTNMTIVSGDGTSQTLPLQVVAAQPNIFAVLNGNGTVNSASNPATPGDTVSIFVSGTGALNPVLPDGTIAASPAPVPAEPVQVNVSQPFAQPPFGGFGFVSQTLTPAYAGGIPGTVIDMLRVDVPLASLVSSGYTSWILSVAVADSSSPAVTLYLALR